MTTQTLSSILLSMASNYAYACRRSELSEAAEKLNNLQTQTDLLRQLIRDSVEREKSLETRLEVTTKALEVLIPMAQAHAIANDVGRNRQMVQWAKAIACGYFSSEDPNKQQTEQEKGTL